MSALIAAMLLLSGCGSSPTQKAVTNGCKTLVETRRDLVAGVLTRSELRERVATAYSFTAEGDNEDLHSTVDSLLRALTKFNDWGAPILIGTLDEAIQSCP
jgi:hypothetical protein